MYILTTASVTSKSPLEAAARAGLTGSDWCPAEPKKATGRPTRRAKEAPVTNNREQYSTRSAAAQEKGKEAERASGIGHCVSGGVLPFRKAAKCIFGIDWWWWWEAAAEGGGHGLGRL
ncbi:YCF36, putative [Actinidia rufa]|uniref:YCF36, putative n=1 Tax=Actinidia rufa TaxID=165716 RepID=A0A7J0GCK0_9ERIC|nr:YCF36, putative [Actinidia rufa]